MASQKQIDANRKNALKSTGPRTVAGKNRSRLNARRHDGYTKLLLPDENEKELRRMERMYLSYYSPQTEVENDRVCELAALEFRLCRRYPRMESEILTSHGFAPDPDSMGGMYYAGPGWALIHDCTKARSTSALSQMEDRLARRVRGLRKELEKLRHRSQTASVDQVEMSGQLKTTVGQADTLGQVGTKGSPVNAAQSSPAHSKVPEPNARFYERLAEAVKKFLF